MHTDQTDREDSIHSSYESSVDDRIDHYSFRYDGRDRARPGATVRKLARRTHRHYDDLVRAYDRYGYNRKVHRITKRQLKDAANAMADLLRRLR